MAAEFNGGLVFSVKIAAAGDEQTIFHCDIHIVSRGFLIVIRGLDRSDAETIPIIALTANAFSEDRSKALAAGMNAHVTKPIDMANLCSVLAEVFSS